MASLNACSSWNLLLHVKERLSFPRLDTEQALALSELQNLTAKCPSTLEVASIQSVASVLTLPVRVQSTRHEAIVNQHFSPVAGATHQKLQHAVGA